MARSKKKPRKRLSHEPSRLKRVVVVFCILLLCVSILVGFWWLAQLGPKNVDYSALLNSEAEVVADEVTALQEESLKLEADFEEILAMRDPEPQDIILIKRALELQRAYVEALTNYNADAAQRVRALDERFQDLSAASLLRDSLVIENEAIELAREDQFQKGREKYGEALSMQREINENFPLSNAQNHGRATRLQRQVQYLTAEPLVRESIAEEKKADALIVEKNWSDAEAALRQSILIQERLNSDYQGANQASVARSEHLKTKLIGIRSGQSYIEVERIADLADVRRAEGENLEAAALYDEAARLQRQLNGAYKGSLYASSERVSEFQRKSQTAQSFELGIEIEQNHERLRKLLAERRTYEAAEVIVALRRDIEQMAKAYPRSSLNDEELQVKIKYLNLVQNDLGFVQDRIFGALLPIPGETEWKLLRTEVPQALYSLIMGTNPSRNLGDTNPVDSVSWIEAQAFAERLSWIFGKPVRLPTENEFRQALGPLRYVVLENHVWSVSNADGIARPIGTKEPFSSGFYDLLGNVSEWLESESRFESEDTIHIGGHSQDRLEAIFTVPVRNAPRGERNRMTGFRIAVKAD